MKYILLLFFIVCTWSNLYYVQGLEAEGIIGGDPDENNRFNYQVSIQKKKDGHYKNGCGGSIIAPQFILTAAHCFVKKDDKETLDISHNVIRVLAGTSKLNDPKAIYRYMDKVYFPKNFKHGNLKYIPHDIAVVKLNKPLDIENDPRLSTIKMSKNIKYKDLVGKIATTSGFGLVHYKILENGKDETIFPNTRQYLDIKLISKDMCTPYDQIICATNVVVDNENHSICHGDSGGPLVYKNKLIAVVSRGSKHCDMRQKKAKFTLISPYTDFIERAMKDNSDKSDMRILNGSK